MKDLYPKEDMIVSVQAVNIRDVIIQAVVALLIFALLTFENRLYSTGEMVRYLTAASVFTVIYYLIWELWLTAMEQSIWKEAKRRR